MLFLQFFADFMRILFEFIGLMPLIASVDTFNETRAASYACGFDYQTKQIFVNLCEIGTQMFFLDWMVL